MRLERRRRERERPRSRRCGGRAEGEGGRAEAIAVGVQKWANGHGLAGRRASRLGRASRVVVGRVAGPGCGDAARPPARAGLLGLPAALMARTRLRVRLERRKGRCRGQAAAGAAAGAGPAASGGCRLRRARIAGCGPGLRRGDRVPRLNGPCCQGVSESCALMELSLRIANGAQPKSLELAAFPTASWSSPTASR